LNFDAEGGFVFDSDSPSDAEIDRHACEFVGSGALDQGYGSGPKREEVLAGVKTFLAPYRVAVTEERPTESVDYSMVVFTPGPNANVITCNGGGLDCDDLNPRDVWFFHLNEGDAFDVEVHTRFLTAAIVQQTGLAATEDNTDIMYPFLGEGPGLIQDACVEIRTSSSYCGVDAGCGDIFEQNAHQWLAEKWGIRG
jgi:hypothetical protein